MLNISSITHPEYDRNLSNWSKYRLTYEGGDKFIDQYLKRFSTRESMLDFQLRREISYCPAHAKAAVIEIQNSIYQRMVDIVRENGPQSYQQAITGEDSIGVDRRGNGINGFIGRKVLPELLSISRVGIYIDKQAIPEAASLADTRKVRPYMYVYRAEDIRSYTYSEDRLVSLLLRDHVDEIDPDTGLTVGTVEGYRHLVVTDAGVKVTFYDDRGKQQYQLLLNMSIIPFVILDLSNSLLADVANYQIALLNAASSDMNYIMKANFPFYTEQFSPQTEMLANMGVKNVDNPGTGEVANKTADNELRIGAAQGRRYPSGLDRPEFIHPSPDPLIASMDKQERLKADIRQLVNLALVNMSPSRVSTKTTEYNNQGLEAGLAHIGMELETGERLIARIWSMYEGYKEDTIIKYPTKYSLLTDDERRKEAKELTEEMTKIPSLTYQKVVAKRVVDVLLGAKISSAELNTIYTEIQGAKVIVIDPAIVKQDHEAGFVSTEMASQIRGYPEGQVEQAKKDHAERAARIAIAQSKASARGVADMSADDDAKDEKTVSQDPDNDANAHKNVRGDA